ncbi:MAG: hypothetical protein ACXAC7_00655 [Candidatus Hodarchaeales archaeon]
MAKFCPSCGKQNHDVLENCWNCATWLGKGHVDMLETKEGANQVAKDFNIEAYDEQKPTTIGKEVTKKKGLALVTLYGMSKTDTDELMKKHGIKYQLAEIPGLCQSDEAITEEQERQKMISQAPMTTPRPSRGTSGGYYYYDDYTTGWCCYYACTPSRRYRSYHSQRSSSCYGGSSDCDCNDSGSDSDELGAIVVLAILVLLIAVLILFAPAIGAAGLVALELFGALLIFGFNILTLGLFRKKLSRTRVRILEADQQKLDMLFDEMLDHGALPKMHGYWSSGFSAVRYGAQFFMVGLIVLVITAFFAGLENKKLYALPGSVIFISISSFVIGYYAINRKVNEIRTKYFSQGKAM